MTTAITTITLTAPTGTTAEIWNAAQDAVREAYHRHVIHSDWDCELADIIPAEGDAWSVATRVVVDGDDIGHDAGLNERVLQAISDEVAS